MYLNSGITFNFFIMKHLSILLILLSVFINYSCTDESQNNLQGLEIDTSVTTKSLHPLDFEKDWENQTSIQLTDNKIYDLPWVEYAPTSIIHDVRMDIKKQNGWVFLSTPSNDNGTDYLIFYNKYSGVLKVFYYNRNSFLNNNAVWEFFDEKNYGYFNQGTTFTAPMNQTSLQRVGVNCLSNNTTLGIDQGWNCFQIPIVYTGKTDGSINVYSKVLNILELSLAGNYKETTTGTIIEDHYSSSPNLLQKGANSVVKAGGEAAEKWVKKEAEKATKNISSGIFKNVTSQILGGLVKEGVAGLISGGLNALFGSFLGSKDVNEPVLRTVELSTNGTIDLKGQMISNSSIPILPLTAIKYDDGFGAWNLASAPTVYITGTYHELIAKPEIASEYNCKYAGKYYSLLFEPRFNLVINPSIVDEVTYKVNSELVEFQGSEWDDLFNKYYNITRNRSFDSGTYKYLPSKSSGYDTAPTVVQNAEKGTKVNSLSYYEYPIIISDEDIYIKGYSVYAETFNIYNNKVFSSMARYNRTDIDSFPSSMSNMCFNGKPVLYVANIGVNITVTMTVKSTGQKIVSSRTYLPELNIKFR